MQEPRPVRIKSVLFPKIYLRMDARNVIGAGAGGGTINCQYGAGPWEELLLVLQPDGTNAFASLSFPGVYLRLDGRGLTEPQEHGGGVVSCHMGVGPLEKFWIMDVPDGSGTVIESSAFKGVFLRMDGANVKIFDKMGGGKVNAQYSAGDHERFVLEYQ